MHYNVLADQYASNMLPWFLYGAEPAVSAEERAALFEKFYERDDSGRLVNKGFDRWASDELLSAERREMIQAYNERVFAWPARSAKLWSEICEASADIVTLAECDHFDDFWRPKLQSKGFESSWRKRPRV